MKSIRVSTEGVITMVYSDQFAALLDEGRSEIRRASNVEPLPGGGWAADLAPVGGPLLNNGGQGFRLRADALAAEVTWLEKNYISQGSSL